MTRCNANIYDVALIEVHTFLVTPCAQTIAGSFTKKLCCYGISTISAPNMEGIKNPVRNSPLDGFSGIDNSVHRRC